LRILVVVEMYRLLPLGRRGTGGEGREEGRREGRKEEWRERKVSSVTHE
jgi:hypothetical protein